MIFWKKRGRGGFTLIEIITVVTIIAILLSAGIFSYRKLVEKTRLATCQTNLRAINLALYMYREDFGQFPDANANLAEALRPYKISPSLFHCPLDPHPQGDSYQAFYIHRPSRDDPTAFIIGCPYHNKGNEAVNLLFGYEPLSLPLLKKVTLNDQDISFGEVKSWQAGDELKFYDIDGRLFATVEVVEDVDRGSVIQSFRLPDNRPYGIIKIDTDDYSKVRCQVDRAKFEVVTPAAIAGVQGTQFAVEITYSNGVHETKVTVDEGKVKLVNLSTEEETLITAPPQDSATAEFVPLEEVCEIRVIPEYTTIEVGDSIQFTAKGYDENGNEVPLPRLKWKVKALVWPCGKINQHGVYTATKKGVDLIVAQVGKIKSYAYVVVKEED